MSTSENQPTVQGDRPSYRAPEASATSTDPRWKQTIATYSDYPSAQAAVDFLSDAEFPVERIAIVGQDVRTVENVTGRVTKGKAALRGLAGGAWFGLFVGLLFGIFAPAFGWVGILLLSVVVGAVWGAVFGFLGHLATGGQRDFASVSTLEAARYEVQVEAAFAAEASRLLATAPVRSA